MWIFVGSERDRGLTEKNKATQLALDRMKGCVEDWESIFVDFRSVRGGQATDARRNLHMVVQGVKHVRDSPLLAPGSAGCRAGIRWSVRCLDVPCLAIPRLARQIGCRE